MDSAPLPGWPGDAEPFHPGEQSLQARAGLRERMAQVGRKVIRDFMPDQHRELFEKLPFLVAGSVDAQGRPWASLLVGRPGFVASPDARTLAIGTLPAAGDPLAQQLRVGAPLGLLGIELPTRRRNRMNGEVLAVHAEGFTVRVQQSFGNCPQYIQTRAPLAPWDSALSTAPPVAAEHEGAALGPEAEALVRDADTFFIATAALRGDTTGGADVSHRGGRPGFVRVQRQGTRTVLTAPDFRGNYFFNTLGNIAEHPRAGLLFIDFERGHLLSLTGSARVIWDGPEVAAFDGAERLLQLEVDEALWLRHALPPRWSAPQPAPQLAATGRWPTHP